MQILHITAHMGGGAGKAVAGLMLQCAKQKNIEQKLLVLEVPEKLKYIHDLEEKDMEIIIGDTFDLTSLTEWADIIVISWWNHPVMSKIFPEISRLECRIALWTHINGCVYPYLPFAFADLPEMLFVTTKYTLNNPLWSTKEREKIGSKAQLVNGIGDFKPETILPKDNYEIADKFVVGYAGTLNYAKLHKDYLVYCQTAIQKIPDIHFLIVGDKGEQLQEEIRQQGLADYFSFTGYVDNVYKQYLRMDVMGYLLNEDNYGTTENVILEAMAVGLPVIACKNGPESYILQDHVNGYLIKTPEQYAECLSRLHDSKELRQQIGKSAREYVIQNYSIEITTKNFLEGMNKIIVFPKKRHDFEKITGTTVFEWFKTFTGPDEPFFNGLGQKSREEKRCFLENCLPIYKEKTKSSFKHFLSYYECEELRSLLKEME